MATANFYNKNASYIYAIVPGDEYDDYIYDDVETNVSEAIGEYVKNSKAYLGYSNNKYIDDYLIEVVSITEEVAGISLSVNIEILMRPAYYWGANLDYEINYKVESVEFDDLSEAFQAYYDVATWDFDMNKGLAKIQAKNAANRLENITNELVENVEKILEANCTHVLQVVARFSNGETLYSEVKKY